MASKTRIETTGRRVSFERRRNIVGAIKSAQYHQQSSAMQRMLWQVLHSDLRTSVQKASFTQKSM